MQGNHGLFERRELLWIRAQLLNLACQVSWFFEPFGWVYYAWPYAYSANESRWYFFNAEDQQWRVNLSTSQWGTLTAATGWNYYAWPYSYSTDLSSWHWYNLDVQWLIDLQADEWMRLGRSAD